MEIRQILRRFSEKFIIASIILLIFSLSVTVTSALAQPYKIPFNADDAGTVEITDHHEPEESQRNVADGARAEDTVISEAGDASGAIISLRSVFINSYYFIKYIAIGFGILYLSFAGFRMVVAGKEIEEVVSKEKLNIKWTLYGLVALLLVDTIVAGFFGTGDVAGKDIAGRMLHTTDDSLLYKRARFFGGELLGVIYFIMQIITGIAVLVIVEASVRMLVSSANEDVVSRQKKVAVSVMVGLIVMRLSYVIVGEVLFGVANPIKGIEKTDKDMLGRMVNPIKGAEQILGFANYILGFVAVLAVLSIVYAGFRIVTAAGNEEQIGQAKDILKSAAIGIVIAISSYTIVATFIAPHSVG